MRDLTGRTDQAEQARRRQNRSVAAMAIAAIVAIVTVVVGPWRGGRDMTDRPGSAEQAQPGTATTPPDVDLRAPHLIVSPASVPVAGGDVALILANPGTEQVSFGVAGRLDRWEGGSWVSHRQVTAGLNPQAAAGKLVSLDEDLVVPMVYIGVEPGSFSGPRWTHVEGIEPGWYRFTFGPASGLFQVGPSGFTATRPATAFTFESEGVVRSGTAGTLHLRVVPRERLHGSFDPAEQVGDYTGDALVQRLDGAQGPETVAADPAYPADPADTADPEGADEPLSFALHLPALEPGVYRASRPTSIAGRVESLFWAAPLESPH